ncbi:MAG: hypothetical protein ACRC41_14580 [Sarcina sp.]
MEKCLYCGKELNKKSYENKIGYFCSQEHFDKYLEGLSDDEYIQIQNSFCVCSDE